MLMKKKTYFLIGASVMATSLPLVAQDSQSNEPEVEQGEHMTAEEAGETEKEWAVLSHPNDLNKILEWSKTLKAVNTKQYKVAEDAREFARVKKILALKPEPISAKDLLGLRRVRSIQVGKHGVFKYRYFSCKFKEKEEGLFFEKTSGSQRKSGTVFKDEPTQLVFLGGWSVNDDPQWNYSGLTSRKPGKHDSVGVFIKRGGQVLALFPEGPGGYEVYEFLK